ncbi:MAG TPA: hypothetical protein VIG08_13340 [Gemmatimonadales bacterium]|jgi:hypothetical protein
MALTRDDVRASVERAGDANWRALVSHHEDAYPASRPTPGDVCRGEAQRLNEAGYGDPKRYELLESRVTREESTVTLIHSLREVATGARIETPAYTDYE